MLIFAVNFALNGIICLRMVISPPKMNGLRTTIASSKPLFRKIMEFYPPIILPIMTIWFILFYFSYGPKIIKSLDYFHKVYNQNKKKQTLLTIWIVFNLYLLICFKKDTFYLTDPLKLCWRLYSFNIYSLHDFLVWGIVVYYKYGTYRLLCDTHYDLINSTCQIADREILKTIQVLAQQNDKMNRIISIPIIAFFVLNGTFQIILISVALLDTIGNYNYDYTLYNWMLSICFVCSIHFSMKIDQMLTTIGNVLSDRSNWKIASQTESPPLALDQQPGKSLFQISLYQKYFQLKLFDCVTLDYNFILSYALFICSYVLIIIQTS